MKSILLPENSLQHTHLREYHNYPSLILPKAKSCKMLIDCAKHYWKLLYNLSKFDRKRFIDISIENIKSILSESKNDRMIQGYLSQLAEYDFITINKNCASYVRIEDAYSIKAPGFNLTQLEPLKAFNGGTPS